MTTEISKLLKKYREEYGLSQSDVAQALGHTNPQYISNMERGICSVPAHSAKALCKILHIPKDVLFKAIQTDWKNNFLRKWDK